MPAYKRLGEVLISEGMVTADQIKEAISLQSKEGGKLGEILVKLGYIDEEQIVYALSKQLSIPHASLSSGRLKPRSDEKLKEMVPYDFAIRNLVLPLSRDLNVLTVAVFDPLDLILIDNLRKLTGYEINPLVSTRSDIIKAIENFNSNMIEPELMPNSIKTDLYFGGQLYEDHGAVHPRKFHYGLLQLALKAGAKVLGKSPVSKVKPVSKDAVIGFKVFTSNTTIQCNQVLMATNGYTRPSLSKYLSRRILPVPSYIITTEDIGVERVQSLLPGGHCMVETRKRYCYYRATPCGRRIMLGTRAAMHSITAEQALPTLRKMLIEIFPSLADVQISHCWTGFTGFSFSQLPSLSSNKGIYSALGYCGNGVAMAPYLGHKAALKILNPNQRATVFEQTPLETRPYYFGKPWFLPIVSAYFRAYDLFDYYRRKRSLKKI